jgi:hypothetical protein
MRLQGQRTGTRLEYETVIDGFGASWPVWLPLDGARLRASVPAYELPAVLHVVVLIDITCAHQWSVHGRMNAAIWSAMLKWWAEGTAMGNVAHRGAAGDAHR